MKSYVAILFIAILLIFLGFSSGLLGKGKYLSNFEKEIFDREGTFVSPTLSVNGLAVYVVGDGEPILVLPYPHAGTQVPMAQSEFTQIFTSLGRQVITFDVPGAYASTREPQVSMREMLECALEALKAAGVEEKIDVAGHSMGGLVALAFALEHPDRVDQLLLINTLSGFKASLKWGMPGSAWSWYEKEYWQLMYWGIRLQNGRGDLAMHKRLMHLMQQASFFDKSHVPPLEINESDRKTPTPVRFQWSKALWDINYAAVLGNIAAPTLITAGQYDPQTPMECAQELANGIPDNRLEIFSSSGHNPFIEEKEQFLEVVGGFLAE